MRFALAVLALAGCDRAFGLTTATDAPAADGASGLDALHPRDAPGADAALQPGVAHYTFDAVGPPGGPCLLDDSGNGHTGACVGDRPQISAGHIGSAFALGGTTRIQIDPGAALGGPNAFTIAGWFEYTSSPISGMCPFNRRYGSSGADSWQVCIDGFGEPVFYYTGASIESGPVIAQNAWHHLAIAYTGNEVMSYVDGALVGDDPGTLDFDFNPILLGADFDGTTETNEVIGGIDDVWIFDRALSSAEILSLENQ